mmetsp:Transcript_12427/g.18654  ORF Transcript_12427/g.18654 Transcript_12427/m.18654 type:complete len:181 (-) Transcript_12427:149-691(-)
MAIRLANTLKSNRVISTNINVFKLGKFARSSSSNSSSHSPNRKDKNASGNNSLDFSSGESKKFSLIESANNSLFPFYMVRHEAPPRLFTLQETDFGVNEELREFGKLAIADLSIKDFDEVLNELNQLNIVNSEDQILTVKRTFQPSNLRRNRKHGFLNRINDRNGRKIIERRRKKGRAKI